MDMWLLVVKKPHFGWKPKHRENSTRGAPFAKGIAGHTFLRDCRLVNRRNQASRDEVGHCQSSSVVVHVGSVKYHATDTFYFRSVPLNPLFHSRAICHLPLNHTAEFTVDISAQRSFVLLPRNSSKGASQHLFTDDTLCYLSPTHINVGRRRRISRD
jgi:hypothetical protein